MNSEEVNKIAETVAEQVSGIVDNVLGLIKDIPANVPAKQEEAPKPDEISQGVKNWIENKPGNDPDPKEVSDGVAAWVRDKDKRENPGKDLGPKVDQGPTHVHGVLTGKTV